MSFQTPNTNKATAGWKLPKRWTALAFAFYMSATMAALMSMVIVGVNSGVGEGFFTRVAHAYILAMPTGLLCVLLVRPLVIKLLALSVRA